MDLKLKRGKKICMRTAAPFSELEKALEALNNVKHNEIKENQCQTLSRRPGNYLYDKMRSRFADHIKNAIFKKDWENLRSLILAYIDDMDCNETRIRTFLLNISLIYLLNNEDAKSRRLLRDFFKLIFKHRDDDLDKMLLKRCMTLKKQGK